MAIRKKYIRALVEKIILDHHILEPAVDVERISQSFGVEIKKTDEDDDLSGFLVRNSNDGRTVIGVNTRHHPNRQRFTIAHELGHFLLHEGEVVHFDSEKPGFMLNLRSKDSAARDSNLEKEANYFAAELLMPARFLERDRRISKVDLLDDDKAGVVRDLANEYQVSVSALTFRLANLGLIQEL